MNLYRRLKHVSTFPRSQSLPSRCKQHPSEIGGSRECRAFGSPAASCAKVKSTRVSHHRSAETIRHSLRDGLTVSFVVSPETGLCCLRPQRDAKHHRKVDTSVGVSERYDFAVRPGHAFVLRTTSGHRIPHPTSVTIAKRPSWWARDARRDASDLPDVTSEMICDTMARRANQ